MTALKTDTVCVIGTGYVGLPLAEVLSDSHRVISFDIDVDRVRDLSERNVNPNHLFTADPGLIADAEFVLICVPTPLSQGKRTDMSYLKGATATVGRHMKKGTIVVNESSVYPGATEDLLKPILENMSGYVCGRDFHLAYSPERINPGDLDHNVARVTKIVAAADEETLERVADLYLSVAPRVFKARNIRTAEAAKLVENTQRDLNIALVNELAMLFERLGINTNDVLEAAATKWNFQRFSPGLVGGYCIPVVPYFLVQKAEEHGFRPQVILAGRAVNDSMPKYIAEMAVKSLNQAGKVIKGSKALIMGCSYKENASDIRETPVRGMIQELREYGVETFGYDPLISDADSDLGINFVANLNAAPKMDVIVLAVYHDIFKEIPIRRLLEILNTPPIIIDIRGRLDPAEIAGSGIIYKRL